MNSRSPEFQDRLYREIRLYMRELRDGCNDCLAIPIVRGQWAFCKKHQIEVDEVCDHPRKYFDLKAKKRGQQ